MLPLSNLFSLFISGGPVGMILITLLFIGLFFAAWKASAWVKEIGIAALVVGIFWTLYGLIDSARNPQAANLTPSFPRKIKAQEEPLDGALAGGDVL